MTTRIVKEIFHNYQPIVPPKQIRVCAYVRVSTGHDGQLNSLRNQTEYYNQKLSNYPNYVFIGVFSDAGISGTKENRPGFQEMLKKAKAGEIDLIFAKSISRFARKYQHIKLKFKKEI